MFATFAEASVASLVLKGTGLAYSLYEQPYLRTRSDTDVLIQPSQRHIVHRLLESLGYEAAESTSRELASYQLSYVSNSSDAPHVIDLHWRISNLQSFARSFSFSELASDAIALPRLHPATRTLAPVHALMLACMHRAAHVNAPFTVDGFTFTEANRLIWLYDIHLLSNSLSPPEWQRFIRLAASKAMRAVCLDGLLAAQTHLHTAIPADVIIGLSAPGPAEPSARYLRQSRWRWHLTELRALPTWHERLCLLSEWAFPPPGHMFRKYGVRNRWLLPWLYLRRTGGIVKLFRRPTRLS